MVFTQLVPGDFIMLTSEANVPADCLTHRACTVNRERLTGESVPVVVERGHPCHALTKLLPQDGSADPFRTGATVVATGSDTFLGNVAMLIHHKEPYY